MRTFAALLLAVVSATSASAQGDPAAPLVKKNVAVKMRDGVTLRADLALPSAQGKFPVLVYRTPYGKDRAIANWSIIKKATTRGYAVIVQDVRGRYNSEGEFVPYQN